MRNYMLLFSVCFLKIKFPRIFKTNPFKYIDLSSERVIAYAMCPDII